MKKYILSTCLLLIGFSQSIYSQDYKTQFKILFSKNDIAGQEKLLQTWEKAKSDDPELYVSYFNFYFNKSRVETLSLTRNSITKDSLRMTKEDDKNVVAYIGSQTSFDKPNFDKAILYIDKGIKKFPNRLDMRFGKISALGQIKDYNAFTKEIVKAIDYSNVNKNQWFWLSGKPVENPKQMFLSSVQSYVVQIFDAGDEYNKDIKTIAEMILRYYPDSVENLSNLAVYYILKEDFDNALPPLLKAEKLAPTDYIVIGNIAMSYYRKGDRINSLKYYQLLLNYGDDKSKLEAREKIDELKKKN